VLGASTFDSACFNLIDLAKQRGGQDNITCILLLALSADIFTALIQLSGREK